MDRDPRAHLRDAKESTRAIAEFVGGRTVDDYLADKNILIHGYAAIDDRTVWRMVKKVFLRRRLRELRRRPSGCPGQLQQAVDLASGMLREVLTREIAVPFPDRRVTRGAHGYRLPKTRRPIVTQRRILGATTFAALKERHSSSPFVPPRLWTFGPYKSNWLGSWPPRPPFPLRIH
jgi:Protein of unknown function DUF86